MMRAMLPALVVLACASAARADDALLPTHLIDGGQVYATETFRYLSGTGDAAVFGSPGDFKQTAYQLQLDAGVGLGMGFEIDASIIAQFNGTTHADFSAAAAEFDTKSRGFSDLALSGIYRLLKDDTAVPQFVVGAIVVAPVGNDKKGQARTRVGGVTIQDQAESGIGQGVWRYGAEAGISKNLVVIEPYLTTSYVFGGKRTENGVHEDRADVWTLTMGAEWALGPTLTLDTRAVFTRTGVDKTENNGALAKEEAHFNYTGQVSLYVQVAPSATLTVGGGVTFPEDHEVNDVVQLTIKDDYLWFVQVGLHILIGGK